MSRSMLFISHANPEDDEFARWLSLRLAAEGYPVWCDLTQLLGGERFWSDIEAAIRERSAKFLFVLSRASNQKPGPLDELQVAFNTAKVESLQDFVIPLWIDDLPAVAFNVRLSGINAVRFTDGWAVGLVRLLRKLSAAHVSVDPRFGPAAVGSWWLENVSASRGLKAEAEQLASNFYPIRDAELFIYRTPVGEAPPPIAPTIPVTTAKGMLATFARPETMLRDQPDLELHETIRLVGTTGVAPVPPVGWGYGDLRRSITSLLNQHWAGYVERAGLHHRTFSNGQPSIYYTLGDLGTDRVQFRSVLDPDTVRSRQLIGYKTMTQRAGGEPRRRYWHFALEARAETELAYGYLLKPHVLFSDDGHTIWTDDERLHRARRTQCKGWWNDKWRDLIHAAVTSMLGEQTDLDFGAPGAPLRVAGTPSLVLAPVSYEEPASEPPTDGARDEDDEIQVDEDELEDWDT